MTLLEAIRYYGKRVYGDPRLKIDDFDIHMLEWLNQLHKIRHIIEDAEDDIKSAPSKVDAATVKRMAYDNIQEVITNGLEI